MLIQSPWASLEPYPTSTLLEFLDVIPKSLSGKILRRELVERERAKGAG